MLLTAASASAGAAHLEVDVPAPPGRPPQSPAPAHPVALRPTAAVCLPVPREFRPPALAEQAWRDAAEMRPGSLVAVTSADGGVGRSTITAALGGLLALAVPDPVIAVDANPRPWGGLADRVGAGSGTVWDAVRYLPRLRTCHDVERWTRQGPSGLLALAGEVEASAHRHPPTHHEVMTVVATLRQLYPLVLLDLMTAESRGVWGAVAAASSALLLARATTDSVRHAMRLLAYQRNADTPKAPAAPLLVVVATSPRTSKEVRAVLQQAATVAAAVHTIPYDPLLATAAPIDPRRLGTDTRRALLALAASVLHTDASSPADTATSMASAS